MNRTFTIVIDLPDDVAADLDGDGLQAVRENLHCDIGDINFLVVSHGETPAMTVDAKLERPQNLGWPDRSTAVLTATLNESKGPQRLTRRIHMRDFIVDKESFAREILNAHDELFRFTRERFKAIMVERLGLEHRLRERR